ncbi:hypothetical protein PN462_01110 [Spirulina sp. CS-785/01]|uniref:hypothetical protein n=1 Tax=Spirulina sp. CS-785/01 TaxID=3021716 RepID=UPI00232DD1AE|nr:hypothetical protein [Spirulina sp. CS-785/01]MDB9311682.1 hypothetical protein [Spirulina sp. CS-785/01]
MEIYVQSRGKLQDNDYCWIPEIPSVLTQHNIIHLVGQSFSLVLARYNAQLFLYLTGLASRPERDDFRGRPVRNSVLWLCSDTPENELKLRGLTIQALQDRNRLSEDCDRAIKLQGELGFTVDFEQLKNLDYSHLCQASNSTSDPSKKIGNNSDNLQQEIAVELASNTLPDYPGLLVLITSIKGKDSLKATGVWRGLSDRVPDEDLEEYAKKKNPLQKGIITLLTLIFLLLLGILILVQLLQPDPQPEPQQNQTFFNNSQNPEKVYFNFSQPVLDCPKSKESNSFILPCFWDDNRS